MTMDVTADIQDFATDIGNTIEKGQSGWFSRVFNAQTGAKAKKFAKEAGIKGGISLTAKAGAMALLAGTGLASAGASVVIAAAIGGAATGAYKVYGLRKEARLNNTEIPSWFGKEAIKALAVSSALSGLGGAYGQDVFHFAVDKAGWLASSFSGLGLGSKIADASDTVIKAAVGTFNIFKNFGISQALAFAPKPQFEIPTTSLTPQAEDLITGDVDAKITLAADDSARIEQADTSVKIAAEPAATTPDAEPANTTPQAAAEKTPSNQPAVEIAATQPASPIEAPVAPQTPVEPEVASVAEAPAPLQAETAPAAIEPATETPAPRETAAAPDTIQPQQPAQNLFVSADDVAAAANTPLSAGFGFNSYAAAAPFSQPAPTGAVAALAASAISEIDVTSKIGEMVDLSKVSKKTAKIVQEALAGDDQSMKDLAVYMLHGTRKGVTQNSEAAIALFKKAASLGNDQAKFDLAKMGLKGEYGVQKAVKASMTQIRELAGEGFRPAKQMLAQIGGTGKSATAAMRKAAGAVGSVAKEHIQASVTEKTLPVSKIYDIGCKGDFTPGTTTICSGPGWDKIKDGEIIRLPIVYTQAASSNPLTNALNAIPNVLNKINEVVKIPTPVSFSMR